MRTLIITLEYPPQVGGIATHVFQEARFLPSGDVFVLVPPETNAGEFDATNPWTVIRKKLLFKFVWPYWFLALWETSRAVKKYKIERIFVHHVLPMAYVARIILWWHKVPFSIFFHGSDIQMAMRKRRRLRFAIKKAEKLFVTSAFVQRRLEEAVGKDVVSTIIYPCPGEDFFAPKDLARTRLLKSELGLEGKKVLLTVARLADGKGYPHLARMLPKLLDKIPNLVWVIIGTGPKEGWFMNFVQKNQLMGTVRFLGAVPYAQLPEFYHLADVFVLLTHPDNEQNEAWGSVFLEANAAGVPVVAGRAGGVEEAVVTGVTGLIVDTYEEDAVVEVIATVLTDVNLANRLTTAGRARAEKTFRWIMQLKPLL